VLGPIFNRELLTVPRRSRHYVTRVAYLGTLLVLAVTAWLATGTWTRTATLSESARLGPLLFRGLTFVQLALFLFFSALSAASAVALEKDRRTFLLLLLTDLRNTEIVLGKVFGSLLPIFLLLLATVPALMLLLLLGGTSLLQVWQALLVIGATVVAAGSLGGLVALWRDRTFQSLALTVLALVLYLCLVLGLGALPLSPATVERWQQWLNPFQALASVHDPTSLTAPGWPPSYVFALIMFGMTLLLTLWGLARLRVWGAGGEPIQQREQPADADTGDDPEKRAAAHAAPGNLRTVGPNPILWREVKTRAYGRRPLLIKVAYGVVLGLIAYFGLAPVVRHVPQGPALPSYIAAYGLLPIGVLSLLLVAAQAATAITSERDTGALDLLLVTDLTPKEFIFGKIGGILWNCKEYLLPPLLLACVYAYYQCLAVPPAHHEELRGPMNVSSLICIVGSLLVLQAFTVVLGIHVALRNSSSRMAIINTLSTIFFLSVGTLVCVALILINRQFEYQWGSFVFFLVAGVGGLWWVLTGDRPSAALTWASWFCPLGVLYTVMNILVARPGSTESADPLIPFLVIGAAFGFTVAAMLVPLVSEFDVAMGRTSGGAD
jgi:ABC-type Na+ efflux pump permease subunit